MEEGRFQPATIRNRDIPLLASVLCVMQDVCMVEQQRQWQRDRLTNITTRLTGMPGGGGLPKGMEEAFAAISELEENQAKECLKYAEAMKKAQEIINGIESESMRTSVKMKYVFDIADTDIRRELNMTRRGFDRAKKCVEDAPNMASVRWQEKYIVAKKGYAAKREEQKNDR